MYAHIIPPECERKQSIYVSHDINMSLRKCFQVRRAERMPENSYSSLYVGSAHLNSLHNNSNSIIWGRRGTGKTHLLRAFVQMVNNDNNSKEIAFYHSCDSLQQGTLSNTPVGDDFERMKHCAFVALLKLLESLVNDIIDSYEILLQDKVFLTKSPREKKQIKTAIESELVHLMELITKGSPILVLAENVDVNTKTANCGFKAQASLGEIKNPFKLVVAALASRARARETTQTLKISYETDLLDIRQSISSLIKKMGVDTMYLCLDEACAIDAVSSLPFLPMFFEFVKRVFFSQKRVSVKIASIREITNLNSKNSADKFFGIQAENDVSEALNLDTIHLKPQDLEQRFLDILVTRVNYFSLSHNYSSDYILDLMFKNKRHFKTLVTISYGIPRAFLRLVEDYLQKIDFNVGRFYFHSYLISGIAIDFYLNEKRSNLALNDDTVFCKINTYIETTHQNIFLLSNSQVKRVLTEINTLVHHQILHRIPSSLTPTQIMDRYKVYYIDSGKYLQVLRDVDLDEYQKAMDEISFLLPNDIAVHPEKYQLDLDKFSSDVYECPQCGGITDVEHPVYKKFGCCSICGSVNSVI